MNIRPAISIPLPWLTILIGRIYPAAKKEDNRKKSTGFKLPRSLQVTKEGKIFIGVLFCIGIAAINTGNNLLYLTVATLLSLIVISGVMSESTLRGIKVRRALPRHIYKGSPAPMLIEVTNRKSILPSYSFKLMEEETPQMEASQSYMIKLPPGESDAATSRYTFKRRGRFLLTGIKVTTSFPFGIFIKGRVENTKDEVVVYPSINTVDRIPLRGNIQSKEGAGSSRKGTGTELYNLRKYTFSDDSRFIHWRSAARSRKLMVKEYEEESENAVMIVFYNQLIRGEEERFEEFVDEAAGLIDRFIDDGCSVGLKTFSEEIPPAPGPGQLERLLYRLALIEPEGGEGPPGLEVVHL